MKHKTPKKKKGEKGREEWRKQVVIENNTKSTWARMLRGEIK